jgi:hypothetical protein
VESEIVSSEGVATPNSIGLSTSSNKRKCWDRHGSQRTSNFLQGERDNHSSRKRLDETCRDGESMTDIHGPNLFRLVEIKKKRKFRCP